MVELKAVGRPGVLALNMIDIAQHRGLEIDTQRLSREFSMPVVGAVATRRRGMDILVGEMERRASRRRTPPPTPGATHRPPRSAPCTARPSAS